MNNNSTNNMNRRGMTDEEGGGQICQILMPMPDKILDVIVIGASFKKSRPFWEDRSLYVKYIFVIKLSHYYSAIQDELLF